LQALRGAVGRCGGLVDNAVDTLDVSWPPVPSTSETLSEDAS